MEAYYNTPVLVLTAVLLLWGVVELLRAKDLDAADNAYMKLIFGIYLAVVFAWQLDGRVTLTVLVLLCAAMKLWVKFRQPVFRRAWMVLPQSLSSYLGVFLFLFLFKGFVADAYAIPSSSMRPGLEKGDLIVVSRSAYGIRSPLSNRVWLPTGQLARGDVVVFSYPLNTRQTYIKRVVGLPGDIVEYRDKVLTVNGVGAAEQHLGSYRYADDAGRQAEHEADLYRSAVADRPVDILKNPDQAAVSAEAWHHFQNRAAELNIDNGLQQSCYYDEDGSGFVCKVPEHSYFVMGDNRDNSADSRYWGFVDDDLLIGKAVAVAFNSGNITRTGLIK